MRFIAAAAFTIGALVLGTGVAHANALRGQHDGFATDEPGVGSYICQQLAFGQTPAQIADELHPIVEVTLG